jgi:hypothetical protein
MKRANVRALMSMAGMSPYEISEELNWWRRVGLTYAQIADVLFDVVWCPAVVRAAHRLAESDCDDLSEDEVNRVFQQEICRYRREEKKRAGA